MNIVMCLNIHYWYCQANFIINFFLFQKSKKSQILNFSKKDFKPYLHIFFINKIIFKVNLYSVMSLSS